MNYDASILTEMKKFLTLFKKKQPHDVVSVRVTKDDCVGDESIAIKKYHGNPFNILRFIASVHSYEMDEDEDAKGNPKPPKIKDVLEHIIHSNGDGCDFIYDITFNGHTLVLVECVCTEDETSFDCDLLTFN